MTVNVFNGCTDDPVSDRASGFTGEQNDELRASVEFPEAGTQRTICDYDEDWYTFELRRTEAVRIDAFFPHAAGADIDISLLDADGNVIASSVSSDDNEDITTETYGVYYVRVYGFRTKRLPLFRSQGDIGRTRASIEERVEVPDPGEVRVPLSFDEPGAVTKC